MSQDNSKRLKKGEKLILEGTLGQSVFFVQSGRLRAILERGGQILEVSTVGPQQVIGEQWLFSQTKSAFTYEAMQETHVLEIPLEVLKLTLEKMNPALKMIFKSMGEELKGARQIQRSKVLEGDFSPMPSSQIAKSLSLIHLAARHLGKPTESGVEVDWNLFRQSLQKFFLEPSSRVLQWARLFKKKGLATYEETVNEEGEVELGKVQISGLQEIEDFAEFFQHYYFKSPSHELITFEETPFRVTQLMAQIGEGKPVDHRKSTLLEFSEISEAFKKNYGLEFKANLFDQLERKGLFVKRKTLDDGRSTVAYDREEFLRISKFWSFLKEIKAWNETGSVSMKEEELPSNGGSASLHCPSCDSELNNDHKFCPECGFKLAA